MDPVELAIVLPENLRLDLDAGIGALAPDSRSIVIPATDEQGVRRLWLRGLDSQAFRALAGTEEASVPFWSPDGKQIAFFAQRRLKRIRLSDGNVQVICDAPLARGGSWGLRNIILFASNTAGPLWRVPADGGEVRPVGALNANRKEFVQRWPLFLPDGDRFLYYSAADTAGVSGVWLGSLSGRPPQMVAVADPFSSPSLAFDDSGKTAVLLYLLRGALVSQPFDPWSGRLNGQATELASGLPFPSSTGSPFQAVNHRALVFVKAGVNRTAPEIVRRDGRLLANPVPPGDFGDVQLSPDGRQFAFERRDPTLGTSNIFSFDLERQASLQVSHGPGNSLNPTWFPDGERLLYSANKGLSIFNLRDGKGGELVAGNFGGYKPQQITRDGKRVLTLYSGEGLDFDVQMLDLASRQHTPVAAGAGNQRQARLSGNEKLIAYTSDDSGRDEIYVKTWDGQRVSQRRWTVSTGGGAFPLWQPRGGNELFYLSPNGTIMAVGVEITAQDVKVAKPTPLFETKAFSYSAVRYPYSIFPDGRFLVNRLVTQSSSPITIRLNWTGARP
jgi:Tol biopolymer transport system component